MFVKCGVALFVLFFFVYCFISGLIFLLCFCFYCSALRVLKFYAFVVFRFVIIFSFCCALFGSACLWPVFLPRLLLPCAVCRCVFFCCVGLSFVCSDLLVRVSVCVFCTCFLVGVMRCSFLFVYVQFVLRRMLCVFFLSIKCVSLTYSHLHLASLSACSFPGTTQCPPPTPLCGFAFGLPDSDFQTISSQSTR